MQPTYDAAYDDAYHRSTSSPLVSNFRFVGDNSWNHAYYPPPSFGRYLYTIPEYSSMENEEGQAV